MQQDIEQVEVIIPTMGIFSDLTNICAWTGNDIESTVMTINADMSVGSSKKICVNIHLKTNAKSENYDASISNEVSRVIRTSKLIEERKFEECDVGHMVNGEAILYSGATIYKMSGESYIHDLNYVTTREQMMEISRQIIDSVEAFYKMGIVHSRLDTDIISMGIEGNTIFMSIEDFRDAYSIKDPEYKMQQWRILSNDPRDRDTGIDITDTKNLLEKLWKKAESMIPSIKGTIHVKGTTFNEIRESLGLKLKD